MVPKVSDYSQCCKATHYQLVPPPYCHYIPVAYILNSIRKHFGYDFMFHIDLYNTESVPLGRNLSIL